MKDTDRYQIRITGTADIEKPIDPSHSLIIGGMVDPYAVTTKDNQNGTHTIEYKCKFIREAQVEQGGKKIKGLDKRKWSQKLRGAIFLTGRDIGIDDDELFYEQSMKKIIANLDDILANE